MMSDSLSRYFLHRLGLLSDELDWPNTKEAVAEALVEQRQVKIDEGIQEAWRVRDVITSLWKQNGIQCDEDWDLDADGDTDIDADADIVERGKSGVVPIEAILETFLPTEEDLAQFLASQLDEDDDEGDYDSDDYDYAYDENEGMPLSIKHVQKAFNAAAFAVVRGDARSLERNIMVVAPTAKDNTTFHHEHDTRHIYVPPLIQVMEQIRVARIQCFNEAIGKFVPPFLKKNNTIPWFHAPIVSNGSYLPPITLTIKEADTKESMNIEQSSLTNRNDDLDKTVRTEKVGSSDVRRELPQKRSTFDSSSSLIDANFTSAYTIGDKRIKVEEVSGDTTKSIEASSTKPTRLPKPETNQIVSSTSITSLRSEQSAQQKTSITVNQSSSIFTGICFDSRACVSRAILCAAAGVMFKTLTPDFQDICIEDSLEKNKCFNLIDSSNVINVPSKLNEWEIDCLEMPCHVLETEAAKAAGSKRKKDSDISIDTILRQATIIGNRALNCALGAARRSDRRHQFRLDIAVSKIKRVFTAFQKGEEATSLCRGKFLVAPSHSLPLVIPNPFLILDSNKRENEAHGTDDEGVETDEERYSECMTKGPMRRNVDDLEWNKICLPRMLSIMRTGSGHAILYDLQWNDRAFRVAELLQNLAIPKPTLTADKRTYDAFLQDRCESEQSTPSSVRGFPNYGPHLIVTAGGLDFESFAAVFGQLGYGLPIIRKKKDEINDGFDGFTAQSNEVLLRVLCYNGSRARRRRIRKHFGTLSPSSDSPYCFLGGQPDSPYHVILATYSAFVEDYSHFCQIPFQAAILDDGMSWLGCAHTDPGGNLGMVWDTGLWSFSDHGAGMAGTGSGSGGTSTSWDFSKDDGGIESDNKHKSSQSMSLSTKNDSGITMHGEKNSRGKLLVGLTCRHKILLASKMRVKSNQQVYKAPVPSLISFLAPQYMDLVRDDWERSKVYQCEQSISYFRKLIARSIVVFCGESNIRGTDDLFSLAVKSLNGDFPSIPATSIFEGEFLEEEGSKRNVLRRKHANLWFRQGSNVLKELQSLSFDPILTAVANWNSMGFVCEEIVTASSLTTSGANGAVTGPAAYRTAVRCGRSFSSEQGLRQHIAAFHAPAGTWLCRTCNVDCGSSQARTHHERTCGIPEAGAQGVLGNAKILAQTVASTRGPKRKEIKNIAAATITKDDGSHSVPGYKGVWVRPSGKYCVKIDGKVMLNDNLDESATVRLFDTVDEAALKYDEIIMERGNEKDIEMNYRPDGSRIIYEEKAVTAKSTKDVEMLGSGARNIVPALSVINIKDLPKHVKPLLRDPNQTSRTGGNSKRYVYAYRGVCRQARKGHDRWQAQISFNGCNHYLGTFDSEWDAAAVYAWAHLILYGEEATKKAQKEGEEAAAAYEQQQKDIAAGKIPSPPPLKPVKKKQNPRFTVRKEKAAVEQVFVNTEVKKKLPTSKNAVMPVEPKANPVEKEYTYTSMYTKKKIPTSVYEWNKLKTECAMMLSSGTKGTSKATLLAGRKDFAITDNAKLLDNIPDRVLASSMSFLQSISSFGNSFKSLPTCIPLTTLAPSALPSVCALLIGLSGHNFSWSLEKFLSTYHKTGVSYAWTSASTLSAEFESGGANESFRSILLSAPCVFGRATMESQKLYSPLRIQPTLGMSIGNVGCNVGGPEYSCSEAAAKIDLLPTQYGTFQFMACNDDDIVTLNGRRIISSMGPFPLRNKDICSVGARVFVFIQKYRSTER